MSITKKMKNDQIFTPPTIANKMLDMIDIDNAIEKRYNILEPSFGDGAFLCLIIEKIINIYNERNMSNSELISFLDNIYGVEIDKKYFDITIKKLNDKLKPLNVSYDWKHLYNMDLLDYCPQSPFDIIIGNPPYIRIHDIKNKHQIDILSKYKFTKGNTDLYIAFFEWSLNNIKNDGRICLITPNSWLTNTSQANFRKYLSDNNLVSSIINYSNFKVFEAISAYTAITLINLNKTNKEATYTLMKNETESCYTTKFDLSQFKNSRWVFANKSDTKFLDDISKRQIKLKDLCDIQHGIATNADKVYIIKKEDIKNFENEILRPVVKASTLDSDNMIIFPYTWSGKFNKYVPIDEEYFMTTYPKTYRYLVSKKSILNKRDMEKNLCWFQYARSQGIQNSFNKKIVLKHVLSNDTDVCEIKELDEKTLVYSGIYIVVKDSSNYNLVRNALLSEEFHKYLMLVGKDMSGGYKNVSAKVVKEFGLNLKREGD